MTVVTRQRALREGHPTITVGDTAWRVPFHDYRHHTPSTRVRVLGEGAARDHFTRQVSVVLLDDAPDLGTRGEVVSVPDVEVGPDALRDHVATPLRPGERYRIPPRWALDLFCPVHGHIHINPTELCEGEPKPAPPLPGDAIRLASRWRWAEPMVKVGEIGVLDGLVGKPGPGGSICFRARPFRDDTVVRSSGGPATIWTSVDELTRTDDTKTLSVWEWRDGIARAHNSVGYTITVPVWDWHPTA